ncbi:MAG: hypothetical protein AAF498_11585 [Pseudomonadota bacterium]
MSGSDSHSGTRLAPRGLSRAAAAQYVGVSPGTFDKLVADGIMPRPVAIRSRKVWDRFKVDAAFEDLSTENENEWDTEWDSQQNDHHT